MNFLGVFIGNAITICCFTYLAIYFNNPWLVLIALLFFQSYRQSTSKNSTDDKKEDDV